jgi:hypothetical protein
MTEFEFIYMMNEMENTISIHIMNFISIIFAMLVTAYFIGAKLTRVMTGAILSLFSLSTVLFSWSIITARQDLLALMSAARQSLLSEQVQVPAFYAFGAPDTVITAVTTALYVILASAYVATLVFFLQSRKRGVAQPTAGID